MNQPAAAAERPSFDAAIRALQALLVERLVTSTSMREHHACDESFHSAQLPDAVAYPRDSEEVAAIVKICAEHRMPVIPFGTGTALEGGVTALQGGLSLDMSEMNQVLVVNPEDMDCTVQAGVTRRALNTYLRDSGLFFPIDPGADASIGGMVATRASGTNAVRYGTMREAVLSLKVVTSSGEIVTTSRRARKSAAGYDMTRLFVGSEGTLGVICEITLRLHPIPECIGAARCRFDSLQGAVSSVIETIQMGVPVARIELLDATAIRVLNRYKDLDYSESPHLFIEFHGTRNWVDEQASIVQQIAADNGGGEFHWSNKSEERSELWRARHDFAYAVQAMRPGSKILSTDVCVPVSRLVECITQTQLDIEQLSLAMPIVGHVGDGNFHVVPAVYPEDAEEMEAIEAFHDKLIARAQAMEGTCTGEHGIGLGKRKYLRRELPGACLLMESVKQALDPLNIMNPGKVL